MTKRLQMAVDLIVSEGKGEDPKEALTQLCRLIGQVGHRYPEHNGVQEIVAMTYWIVAGVER